MLPEKAKARGDLAQPAGWSVRSLEADRGNLRAEQSVIRE